MASDLAGYAAQTAADLELFKSVISTANIAIKSLININGGAAVELLAFVGHLLSTRGKQLVHGFALP
jgi:hypothetical protein